MRKHVIGVGLALAIALPASAAMLPMGGQHYNPVVSGTGQVGSAGPFYTAGTPAWLVPANLIASLSSPIMGVPGFSAYSGTVDSWIYNAGLNRLGFAYRINLDAASAGRLVRASESNPFWQNVTVFDAGADGGGTSTPESGLGWSNGDPFFIERESSLGTPAWDYRHSTCGTTLNPNQSSAIVWFETSARSYMQFGSISLIDGGALGAARILSVIPAPQSALLGVVGVLMACVLRRQT